MRIKTNIQKSNVPMIAIAKKAGFVIGENPKSSATLNAFAERRLLESSNLNRLFTLRN
jgi:hypothetical protein